MKSRTRRSKRIKRFHPILQLFTTAGEPVYRLEQDPPTKPGWYYAVFKKPITSGFVEEIAPLRVWTDFHGTGLYVHDGAYSKISDYRWFGPCAVCIEVKDEG